MEHLARIAFINHVQVFPEALTFVRQHLHKSIDSPIIVDQAISDLPLASLLGDLLLLLFDHHLSRGKIAYDDSAFSQSIGYEMRGFMMTILLLAPFLFGNLFVLIAELEIPA